MNDDLIGPLLSETFVNSAARVSGTFSSGGATAAAAQAVATIIYDATSDAYTLTTNGGSVTFGPGDIDASQSSGNATVYTRTSGPTTDTLTLTKPGTSGRVTYRYVGSAFWQQTVSGASSISGALDAIVYGAATPAAAMPVSGTASYPIDLIGVETGINFVSPLAGTGVAVVDFAQSIVSITGTFPRVVGPSQSAVFTSVARIASGTNAFSGSFGFEDFGTFQGTLAGQFFGPGAAEIGATFAANYVNGRTATGTIMGRADGSLPGNASFDSSAVGLVNSQQFVTREARLAYVSQAETHNNDMPNAFSARTATSEGLSIFYDAATQTYTLVAPDRGQSFNPNNATPFVGDQETLSTSFSAGLSYVRSARWSRRNAGLGPFDYRVADFVFGMPSTAGQVPRTGRGGYAVTFSGYVADSAYLNARLLSGRGTIKVDFGTGALDLNGGLDIAEDYQLATRTPEFAKSTITGTGVLSSTANAFTGGLSFGGIGNYAGQFDGQFFGPGAEEVGASFVASDGDDKAVGTFTGKLDPAIIAAEQTLSGLSAVTTFRSFALHDPFFENRDLTSDPASGSYLFSVPSTGNPLATVDHAFGTADIVAAKTDASQTYYQRSDASGDLSGYIFKPGAGNPVIALSYASFGDLSVANATPGGLGPADRYFLVFGIDTPASLRPMVGTATYSGIARGTGSVMALGYIGDVIGTSSLSADFGSGTVALGLNLATDDVARSPAGNFTLNGSIATNAIFGSQFRGNFYGPNADEFGAVWSVSDSSSGLLTQLHGVAIGKKN